MSLSSKTNFIVNFIMSSIDCFLLFTSESINGCTIIDWIFLNLSNGIDMILEELHHWLGRWICLAILRSSCGRWICSYSNIFVSRASLLLLAIPLLLLLVIGSRSVIVVIVRSFFGNYVTLWLSISLGLGIFLLLLLCFA